MGVFGFACTGGLLPCFGGALWANAVVEKHSATRMNNDFIVKYRLPHDPLWRLVKEDVPQSIRALRAAGFLKIDCLLNQPIPVVWKLAPREPKSESKLRSLE